MDKPFYLLLCLLVCCLGCQETPVGEPTEVDTIDTRPNILWLVAEDLSPYLPMFGDSTVETPNLSWLAAEGVRYPNTFSISGVCAPSRFAIATGLYPSSAGAHHMRTSSRPEYMEQIGIQPYEALPPPEVRMMSEVLRTHGYYCTNNAKKDYQFTMPPTAWNESSAHAHWRNRPTDQPFFSIFNFEITHESQLFQPHGKYHMRYFEDKFPERDQPSKAVSGDEPDEWPWSVDSTLKVSVPPYLPNNRIGRRDVRRVYSNIVEMDRQLGVVLDQLRADGLLDNTIIMFYADHGGPLPRQKRLLYDSGLRVPMIVRYPDARAAGTIDSQLVSFVDFAPTVFSWTGITLPDYLQGQAFDGPQKAGQERDYIFAAADRFDTEYDHKRAVRDRRYKYLRNYQPDRPYYLKVTYRERMPIMQELLRLHAIGQLDSVQMQWFRDQKPPEELFDIQSDPHEIHNLAGDPSYADTLRKLSQACDQWLERIGDMGTIPEAELIQELWGGDQQPRTADPRIDQEGDELVISSETDGASLGYKIFDGEQAPKTWQVYHEPVSVSAADSVHIIAHRIGYKPSKLIRLKPVYE